MIWIVTSITGSIIGSATSKWFDKTALGRWFNKKVEEAFMRNGYKIDQKSLEKTDKIVIKNAQKNSNELKINKTDKNEGGYTNLIQSKDNKRSKKVSSSTMVSGVANAYAF